MVPHAIITVSLATAVLPRLSAFAADHDLRGLGDAVSATLRSTYALVLPAVAMLPVVAPDLASVVWGYGSASASYTRFVGPLSLFAIGVFFFTTHYLMLRGFYALEQTRRVFFIQCVVSSVNILAAIALTRGIDPSQTASRLVVAYAASYAVGAAALVALLARHGIHGALEGNDKLTALARVVVVGVAGTVTYLVLARLVRLDEVSEVTRMLSGRVGRRGGGQGGGRPSNAGKRRATRGGKRRAGR
jgi:putative peptidoglycan lipid II flippase